MKITDVVLFQVQGTWDGPTFPPGDRQAQAIALYPEFNQTTPMKLPSDPADDEISAIYVEIETDEGVSGIFGPIDETQAFVIKTHLKPFLIGRDPLATELLQDQMMRLNRHGRSGFFMTGVSPVDCALWDLKGKAWNQPIYRLLGGPTRETIPVYASMLGFSIAPDDAAATASEYQANGFQAQKWFFRYGPGDGVEGLTKNVAMAQAVREAVGPSYPLMFDAFMGWDVPYAIEMVQALEPLNPTWMEEPIPPERVSSFRKIRQASQVPIATGEHVYTRWQVKELLINDAIDVLQTDPDWNGGITELVKICTLASAFDVPHIAHGHSLLSALHVAGAQSPTTVPYVEYLVRYKPRKQFFHDPIYTPKNGVLALPTLPGLGIVLDEAKIAAQDVLN